MFVIRERLYAHPVDATTDDPRVGRACLAQWVDMLRVLAKGGLKEGATYCSAATHKMQ
jgi:hypothetical protein